MSDDEAIDMGFLSLPWDLQDALLVEHEISEDCVCGPTCEPVERADGSIGWVYIHRPLGSRAGEDLGLFDEDEPA